LNENDKIVDILPDNHPKTENITIEKHQGIIVPGFINSHCHLELSHLHQKIQKGTGLVEFIKQVARGEKYELDLIESKITEADEAMYKAGIVAVGDSGNTINTRETK